MLSGSTAYYYFLDVFNRLAMYVFHVNSLTIVYLKKHYSECVILVIWSYSLHLGSDVVLQHSVDFHVSLSTLSNTLELI